MYKKVGTNLSLTFLVLLPITALAETVIPCDPLDVGNMWKYTETNTLGQSEVHRLVVSNEAGEIIVSEKSILRMAGAMHKQEQIHTLHDEKGAVVLKSVSIGGGFANVELNFPLCGSIDTEVSMLGVETVKVPAGNFEAQVFEITQEGVPSGDGQPTPGNQWLTLYYVPGVGTVKSITVAEVPTPEMTQRTQPNAETAALLQEALTAMQEGKDTSAIIEKLAQTSQPAAGGNAGIQIKMQKNTIMRELVEYDIK